MSDDLISRKAAIAVIAKRSLQCGRYDLGTGYKLEAIQEEIMNLPAAYDVEKVVSQISGAARPGAPEYYLDGRPVIYKEQAIGIIRRGGQRDEQDKN